MFLTQAVPILLSLLVLGDTYLVHTGTGTAAAAEDHTTRVLLIGFRIVVLLNGIRYRLVLQGRGARKGHLSERGLL